MEDAINLTQIVAKPLTYCNTENGNNAIINDYRFNVCLHSLVVTIIIYCCLIDTLLKYYYYYCTIITILTTIIKE